MHLKLGQYLTHGHPVYGHDIDGVGGDDRSNIIMRERAPGFFPAILHSCPSSQLRQLRVLRSRRCPPMRHTTRYETLTARSSDIV